MGSCYTELGAGHLKIEKNICMSDLRSSTFPCAAIEGELRLNEHTVYYCFG